MKTLIFFLLILSVNPVFSQEYKSVLLSELSHEVNRDSTQIILKKDGEFLQGKYKLISETEEGKYSLCEFKDGKVEGTLKFYSDGNLIGTTEFKNGIQNGYDIVYDMTGKHMMWKIHFVNGKKHGITWWADQGNEYFIEGEKVTQKEYEVYEKSKLKE